MSDGAANHHGPLDWSLLDVVEALSGAVYGPVEGDEQLATTLVAHATIDTREVRSGSVFVALQGTRSHGMEFAVEAFERGAVAVLAGTDLDVDDDRWSELLSEAAEHGPVVVASDCDGVTALGRLARAWRRRARWRVVGVTGSSGKTSTKDLLGLLLERSGRRVVASHANWNNEIGVPLTLLAADRDVDVVICEMGMRGPGQIAWLCDVADPDVGIITTAGTAHLELLGSEEAILAAKAELLAGTWQGGIGIFPGAQAELVEAAQRTPDRLLPFGVGEDEAEDSAVLVTELRRTVEGIAGTVDLMGDERAFAVPVHGMHQARNVAAAAAALVSIVGSASLLAQDALIVSADTPGVASAFTSGRGDRTRLDAGGTLINDAYNANPESVRAALDELASVSPAGHGRRIAVLGRMAELGPTGPQLHASVGAHAARLEQIDALVVVGEGLEVDFLAEGWSRTRGEGVLAQFETVGDAVASLASWATSEDVVLVKASNSSGLGELAAALGATYGREGDDA